MHLRLLFVALLPRSSCTCDDAPATSEPLLPVGDPLPIGNHDDDEEPPVVEDAVAFPDPARMLAWMNELARRLDEAWNAVGLRP